MSITERVRLVDGQVSIVTELLRGTRVVVRIPASAPATPSIEHSSAVINQPFTLN